MRGNMREYNDSTAYYPNYAPGERGGLMDSFYKKTPDFAALTRKLAAICTECIPAELFCAGKSVLGRELWAISFGQRNGAVVYAGGFHAQEWITVLLLTYFLEELSQAITKRENLCGISPHQALRKSGVIILPCANPDGLELVANGISSAGMYKSMVHRISGGDLTGWNANVRGVDINHNFDAGFAICKGMEEENGIFAPAKRQYGGPAPESEPETRALCNLCRMYRPSRLVAFHSQGEEIYYDYGPNTPPESRSVAECWAGLCGYTVCSPTGMASHGGFKDWFIQEFCAQGFTLEVGLGTNPLPASDLPDIYSKLKAMLIYGLFKCENLADIGLFS